MSPKRIQRRRSLGWRAPAGAVYVGRGSKWGNPFRPGKSFKVSGSLGMGEATISGFVRSHGEAVELYREYMTEGIADPLNLFGIRLVSTAADEVSELRGKDLMCWCNPDVPCHADVLIELANPEVTA